MAESRPNRIFIVGGSGSGKTTLARAIADSAGLPLYHLDEIARVGGGIGPERPAAERAADVERIAQSARWVVEGVHLGWTDKLLAAADVIVWLDHVSWRGASSRIVRRFVGDAIAEARRQKGLRRFTRIRDYTRQFGHLVWAIVKSAAYHRSLAGGEPGVVDRSRAAEHLELYSHKLVHCRAATDVQSFLDRIDAS